ncbi:uncharacterized protein LOC105021087 isoform X3 [Esox lucius]|uniref:uncharacterized protein LOC105021087 isoform X3 n=1 Tax=Esox lucius TaxID=8010 RepID=UPI0014778360|nr:uncharacterized protein LOC105021087 isoform X3 [Esox lucius]
MTALGHRGVSDPYIHAEKRDPRGRELYNMAGKLVILLCGMLLVASSAILWQYGGDCGLPNELCSCVWHRWQHVPQRVCTLCQETRNQNGHFGHQGGELLRGSEVTKKMT